MPRTVPIKQFIIQRLRYIASNKKTTPATQLRALDRLAVMERIYEVAMKDQEPESGERPENLAKDGLEDTVKAMLDRATKVKRGGGVDGDKLSQS